MIELRERLLTLFHPRSGSTSPCFELDEGLHTALEEHAHLEQRPVEQVQAELVRAGLARLKNSEALEQRWGSLSRREQQVTALTCLGCTNRQVAARLGVSVETVKTHMSNLLVKFDLHSKAGLRMALSEWDFSEWDPAAKQC